MRRLYGEPGYWLKANAEHRQRTKKRLRKFARQLQERPTEAELAVWKRLRDGEHGVWTFQHPFMPFYIADFYNRRLRLVVEIDGGYHDDPLQQFRDQRRDEFIRANRISVLRMTNEDVLGSPDAGLAVIQRRMRAIALVRARQDADRYSLWKAAGR